jgi:hypothetical protein
MFSDLTASYLGGKYADHITSFLECEKRNEFSNLAKTEGTRGP